MHGFVENGRAVLHRLHGRRHDLVGPRLVSGVTAHVPVGDSYQFLWNLWWVRTSALTGRNASVSVLRLS